MANFFLNTLMEVGEDILWGVFCILTLVLQAVLFSVDVGVVEGC